MNLIVVKYMSNFFVILLEKMLCIRPNATAIEKEIEEKKLYDVTRREIKWDEICWK